MIFFESNNKRHFYELHLKSKIWTLSLALHFLIFTFSPNEDMDAHRVIADMNELDERIRSSEQADLINSERDILHQQAIMSQYNNPMTYLTPILIASLVIVSVLVVGKSYFKKRNRKINIQKQ